MGSKNAINMQKDIAPGEQVIWLGYALSQASATTTMAKASPFERELFAWENTMKIISDMNKPDQIKDEGLRAMQRFHKAGQLKAAVLLLMYREDYRPDFEAWKLANPGAIKGFVDAFQMGL